MNKKDNFFRIISKAIKGFFMTYKLTMLFKNMIRSPYSLRSQLSEITVLFNCVS